MKNIRLAVQAEANLQRLRENSYVGRGIICGLDETGQFLVQAGWTMGRSPNSRNRVYTPSDEHGGLFTEAADPSKVEDPSLILYNAMRELDYLDDEPPVRRTVNIVSNGDQTEAVVKGYLNKIGFYKTMAQCSREPDAPNFTPRITAVSYWLDHGVPITLMAIVAKSLWNDDESDCQVYKFKGLGRGFGHCITTYTGDGKPLPSFRGPPYLMPLNGSARQIADTLWGALDADNRVSLVVKCIPKHGPSHMVIRNQYTKVAAVA